MTLDNIEFGVRVTNMALAEVGLAELAYATPFGGIAAPATPETTNRVFRAVILGVVAVGGPEHPMRCTAHPEIDTECHLVPARMALIGATCDLVATEQQVRPLAQSAHHM